MQLEVTVYKNRDNPVELSLTKDGVALANHNAVTRCQVQVGNTLLDSSTAPTLFDLSQADRIVLKFGGAGLTAGVYSSSILYIFDAETTNGLRWCEFTIIVVD